MIRFDLFDTFTSFVQSRGRARQRDAMYVLFVERGNKEHQQKILNLGRFETELDEWRQQRSLHLFDETSNELPYADGAETDSAEEDDIVPEEFNEYFSIPSTAARISYNSSISLLYRYCACLPCDGFSSTNPEFTFSQQKVHGLFKVIVRFPMNCPIDAMESQYFPKKQYAKKAVCFEA